MRLVWLATRWVDLDRVISLDRPEVAGGDLLDKCIPPGTSGKAPRRSPSCDH
jgi:hypothetical protein